MCILLFVQVLVTVKNQWIASIILLLPIGMSSMRGASTSDKNQLNIILHVIRTLALAVSDWELSWMDNPFTTVTKTSAIRFWVCSFAVFFPSALRSWRASHTTVAVAYRFFDRKCMWIFICVIVSYIIYLYFYIMYLLKLSYLMQT